MPYRLTSVCWCCWNAGRPRPIRQDITGRAGSDVGEVLNLVVNFTLDLHQNVYLQYSHLYQGDFIRKTGPPGSPDLLANSRALAPC
jgi:hypothetical protein